jgi:hypothetical protein
LAQMALLEKPLVAAQHWQRVASATRALINAVMHKAQVRSEACESSIGIEIEIGIDSVQVCASVRLDFDTDTDTDFDTETDFDFDFDSKMRRAPTWALCITALINTEKDICPGPAECAGSISNTSCRPHPVRCGVLNCRAARRPRARRCSGRGSPFPA